MRYRTTTRVLSGAEPTDRRVQRTRALLHEALGALMREKTYDRISVADILDRAKVSRSTFYLHFRDKDDLLASGMRALLCGFPARQACATADLTEGMVAFSLPLLTHIQQHQRSARAKLGERGRAILHAHLRTVLAEWILQSLDGARRSSSRSRRAPLTPALLAQHIAATFVLVLHWWLDHDGNASAADADKVFRALVMPLLRSTPV